MEEGTRENVMITAAEAMLVVLVAAVTAAVATGKMDLFYRHAHTHTHILPLCSLTLYVHVR